MKQSNFFGLDASKKTLLIVGGSLGAQSVNRAVLANLDEWQKLGIQVLWQTGKTNYKEISEATKGMESKGIHVREFIYKMDLGYAAADFCDFKGRGNCCIRIMRSG